MVAVGVAHQDEIALHVFSLDCCFRITGNKWIHQNLVLAIIKQECRMSVIRKLNHLVSPPFIIPFSLCYHNI